MSDKNSSIDFELANTVPIIILFIILFFLNLNFNFISEMITTNYPKERLASIDFFRGLTMFLLIGEFTGLFSVFSGEEMQGSLLYSIALQFHHHPWHGLRFWDLIQPFFMFIVGLSMPIAIERRINRGDSKKMIWKHVLIRSILLIFLGWALYCIGPGEITFHFQNVLGRPRRAAGRYHLLLRWFDHTADFCKNRAGGI
mgnify:CR=1 FL=1